MSLLAEDRERIASCPAEALPRLEEAIRRVSRWEDREPATTEPLLQRQGDPAPRRAAEVQRIIGLLEASAAGDDELTSLAKGFILDWNRNFNRSHTIPSPRELEAFTAALAAAAVHLDETTINEMRFTAESFRR